MPHPVGCSCCHSPLDPRNFDVRSELPDAVLDLPEEERSTVWGDRNLMRANGVGAFVRCLMPVRLTGGTRVTYSCWLSVHPDQLQRAVRVWETPEYADLILNGFVANAIRPWAEILGEPTAAEVRVDGDLPYLVPRQGTVLWRVLHEEWDRDDVLSRIGHALPLTIHERITRHWSVDRTAGLAPRTRNGEKRFVGHGRTVCLEAFGVPADSGAEGAIAMMTDGAPRKRDGELTERDGGVMRHAFWFTAQVNGRTQHEFHGWAAVPGDVAGVICMYDDPGDVTWAQETWRSLRHHP